MTDYDKAIISHCEGCDSPRLDVKLYGYKTPEGEFGKAFWCHDCLTVAGMKGAFGALAGGGYNVWPIVYDHTPDPDIRQGGKHAGDPWCDPSAR